MATEKELQDAENEVHAAESALESAVYGLDEVFKEVHRSNMAKLVDGKVIRREDGKILKPAGWTPPDIKGVLFDN
jgi:predicted HAD superfamily Cof-like phosphohydrolase